MTKQELEQCVRETFTRSQGNVIAHDVATGAESVVSIFFPFTESVRVAERRAGSETSGAWLHGRIEGQNFINEFTRRLCESLGAMGVRVCAPSIDERFGIVPGGVLLER